MGKLGLIGAIAGLCGVAFAQTGEPGSASITISGKAISLKFSGASAKGRKIFGGVVPFNKVWQIGDTAPAILHTDVGIVFKGLMVPQGDYALYVLPVDATNWQLILNRQTAPPYNQKSDVGRLPMTVASAPAPEETCRVSVAKTGGLAAKIEVAWGNSVASVAFRIDKADADKEW